MSWTTFLIVFACCAASILAFRVVPVFALKGRELPDGAVRALNLIPAAAFAALVANDLVSPGMFDAGLWPAAAPLASAVLVAVVGWKTKSLLWCIVCGVASYALMSLI